MNYLEGVKFSNGFTAHTGETLKDPEKEGNPSVKKEKSGTEPIIIPIVLKMAEFDHKVYALFFPS